MCYFVVAVVVVATALLHFLSKQRTRKCADGVKLKWQMLGAYKNTNTDARGEKPSMKFSHTFHCYEIEYYKTKWLKNVHTYTYPWYKHTARPFVYKIRFLALILIRLLIFFLFPSSFFESEAPEWCSFVISYTLAIMQAKYSSLSRSIFLFKIEWNQENTTKKKAIYTFAWHILIQCDAMEWGNHVKKITPQKL